MPSRMRTASFLSRFCRLRWHLNPSCSSRITVPSRRGGRRGPAPCSRVFRLELVDGLGEVHHVGEEDGQLLAVGSDLDTLGAGEDRVVDLWRQIFGQLGGEGFKLLVLLCDDFGCSVQLPLVMIANAHQPARGAEQLLVALEQRLEVFLLVWTVEDPFGKQTLRRLPLLQRQRDHRLTSLSHLLEMKLGIV